METKRLIDANDLWTDVMMLPHNGDMISSEEVEQAIKDADTVDAVEVVHGRWISEVVRKPDWKGKMRDYYQAASCSICHNPDPGYGTSNYCPNCGAKMDGDGNA